MMIRKIIGLLLALASAIMLWLFPALATPRHGRPFAGQDLMQFHEAEIAKHERSERITLWVCVSAGVVFGIGVSLVVSGTRRKNRTEPGVGR
jgi:hypothetical protein